MPPKPSHWPGIRFARTDNPSKLSIVVGSVDLEELILAFKELGIDVDKTEATKLLERYMSHYVHFWWDDTFGVCTMRPDRKDGEGRGGVVWQHALGCTYYIIVFPIAS